MSYVQNILDTCAWCVYYTVTVGVRRLGNTMAPRKIAERSRGWALTLNNYTEDEVTQLHMCFESDSKCEFWILGREIGEEGTPHIQGYVYWLNARTFNSVRETLNNERIHIEKAKAGPQQNRSYCAKDGNYIEKEGRYKTPPKPYRKPEKVTKTPMRIIKELMMAEIELESNIKHWRDNEKNMSLPLNLRRAASNFAAEYEDILDSDENEILKWYRNLISKRENLGIE